MPQFSRASVIEAFSLYKDLEHSLLDELLLKFSLEDIARRGQETMRSENTMQSRINTICEYLIKNPALLGPHGGSLIYEIIENIVEDTELHIPDSISTEHPRFLHSLKRDGYTVVDGKLKTLLPDTLQIASKESELMELLDKHSFSISKGHLEQAMNAHTRGDWAACNGQLRTFVESLFDEIAYRLGNTNNPAPTSTSHDRREFLARLNPPFFDSNLNEWSIGRQGGFVQGFWTRLHPNGSHPGLSDEDDSTFRLHEVLLVAHHFMRRFDRRIAP